MTRVVIAQHAAERYVERVKPCLTVSAAAAELIRLAELAGDPGEKPAWVRNDERREQMDGWLTICDGICLPLRRAGDRLVAQTVLTRAGLSPEARAARKRAKQKAKKQDRKTTRSARVGNRERWEDEAA